MEKDQEQKITKIRKRDGRIVEFTQDKITNAIFNAAKSVGGHDLKEAKALSDKVITIIEYQFSDGQVPTVEEAQDIVEKVLIKSGHAKTAKAYILYRQQHAKIRATKETYVDVVNTIGSYLGQTDWRVKENSNEDFSFSGLMLYISGKVIANYMLNEIYTPEISDAHKKGYYHIHDLSHGLIGYSFYRNETVTVRETGTKQIYVLALEQLFNLVDRDIETENGFEIKYPDNFEILDENGWVKVERVLRHKTEKPLISVNSVNGRNLIVTSDHPFITLEENFSVNCPSCKSNDIYKTRSNRICKDGTNKDYYRCSSCSKTFSAKVSRPDTKRRVEKLAGEIGMANYILTPSYTIDGQSRIGLSAEDGWFVGLFVAEGYFKKQYLSFEMLSDSAPFIKLQAYLDSRGIQYNLSNRSSNGTLQMLHHGTAILDIQLQSLSTKMQSLFLTIRQYSDNKNLPINFITYTPEIVGGMVSGVIDGDGVVRNDDSWVSRVNIRVTSKTLLSQIQFWAESQSINSSLSTIDSYGERQIGETVVSSKKQLYSLTMYIPENKSNLFKECLKINSDFMFSQKEYIKKEYSVPRKIEYVKNDSEYVYDITTSSHTFICNSVLSHNCAGWSLKNLLKMGFGNVPNKVDAKPAKHMDVVVHQMVNYIGCLQMEFAGAQAFSSVDTLLAPFVKTDKLTYKQVKQNMQELVFSLNIPSRWGSQYPFSNLTFDLTVPEDMKGQKAIVGGKEQDFTYADCQAEMEMINKAFLEVMLEGDANGRIFTFPIPTYNLTKKFDWDSETAKKLFELTAKYGSPYFQNYIGSNLDPKSIRAMCCRLNLNQLELINRPGHIFAAGDSTGSLGVVTINLNRLAYEAKGDESKFHEKIAHYMTLAKNSLEIKRKIVNQNLKQGLMPYTKTYLGTFRNHFSTIGLCGMHEACLNFLGKGIETEKGKQFAIDTLNFMRKMLKDFQQETGNLYNLEATPAESTSYRLAKMDKNLYPDIITAGKDTPYLTNSTQLPVNHTDDVIDALTHQNDIQPLYTGGTIFHTFLGEKLPDWKSAMMLVKKISHNTRIPYFSITPTFSVCSEHGYISGEHHVCPYDGKPLERKENVLSKEVV